MYVLTPLNCPPLHEVPEELSWDMPLERRPPLSDLTVQHVGQHMALVVADTLENATAAAALFDLEYVARPALTDAHDVLAAATEPDEQNGRVRHGSYLSRPLREVVGREAAGSARRTAGSNAAHRVAARYTTPQNAHYPIELSATVAYWAGDELTVHDSTRWIAGERTALAAYLGIGEDRVRVLAPLVGGAFGSKSFLWMHVVLCAVAAREVGRPVKLVLTRDQMFSSTGHRPRTVQDLVLLADDDARVLSTEHHTLTETSTVAHFCEPAGLSTRFLYHSPHLEVSHRTARLNAPTPCFMRGPGEAPGLFALETAIDELAHEAGLDPLELRLRNHADDDQASGKPWSGKHLLECYRKGAKRFGWDGRPLEPRALRRGGVQVGWGVATATYPGRRMPASCRVRTAADGTVQFASATHEVGNGVRTVMTQVAADVTGLAAVPGRLRLRRLRFSRRPVQRCLADHRDRRLGGPRGGHRMETATLALAGADADPANVDLAELAGVLSFTVDSDAGDQSGQAFQSFGAHFCEVEVDEQIGRATVVRWVAVMDCGRVLNPKLARNQVMGGITFGLGMALLEQVPYDADTAQMIGEYYLPTHADRPEFDISFVDEADFGLDPIGVRGIGEIGTCGVAAAIANAIFHATGKRLRDLPITLEDLMTPYRPPTAEVAR